MSTVKQPKRLTVDRIGVGLYSLPEAARIVGVHVNKLRRWVDPSDSLFPLYFDSAERTVTFLELLELQFIAIFRNEGVSLQTIRKAAVTAKRRFGTNYPFAVKRFDTDGRSIFATLRSEETDRTVVEDLRRGQYVFNQLMRPFFRKLEYGRQDEAMRYWPMNRKGRVVLDPVRSFGKPIDSETGVPTRAIYDAVNAGKGQDRRTVAKWFDIPLGAVSAAVRFEKSLAT